jgi:hypothetical protein
VAALAAIPVPKSAHIRPVSLKALACTQQSAYLEVFLRELDKELDAIYLVVDTSLSTKKQLQATAAVLIYQQKDLIK